MWLAVSIEDFTLWFWLAVFVIAFIIEATTQELVSIWFGIGALVTLCISGFSAWWAELIVFAVVSGATLILTRPLVKKLTARTVRYTNMDETIGRLVKVDKEISKFTPGEVKLNSVIYQAVLPENVDESINAGTIVEVVAFKGNKVIVRNVENKEENVNVFNG